MKKRFVTVLIGIIQTCSCFAGSVEESNKKLVREFYEKVFLQHQVKEAAEMYITPGYIQHNPYVATGRQPFIDYFVPFFQQNPKSQSDIKSIFADGDRVVLHVHATKNREDLGRAVVDIFRVEGGKIVEHWDVMQSIPEKSTNSNTMF